MAISVKTKFAGFLRGLIGRADHRAPVRQVASSAPAAPAPAPAVKSPTPTPVSERIPSHNGSEIEIPLASIVAGLPLELKAKLMSGPAAGQTIRLSAEMIINQLAFGVVKISFGQLRQLAPGAFVNSGGDLDGKLISLPLGEILPRLNPAMLARRGGRKVEVAAEIVGPFAERGRGFTFTTQPLKGAIASPAEPPAAPAPESPIPVPSAAGLRQASPPPIMPPIPQRSITPATPITPAPPAVHTNGAGSNGHAHALPVSPLSPRSVTPASGGNGSHGNGHGAALPPGLRLGSLNGATGTNGNHTTNGAKGANGGAHAEIPRLKMSAEPTPPPATQLPVSPLAAPAQPVITIFVPLAALCEHWPDALKEEIRCAPLAGAKVPLDGAVIEPGLKRGRVLMTWKQIRILAQPDSAVSPHDPAEVELPLRVLAPLFLAAKKGAAPAQTKLAVSSDIPDLFFGFPQPAAAPVAQAAPVIPPLPKPQEPLPTPVVPPLARPVEPATPAAQRQDTSFFVWTEKGGAPAAEDTTMRRATVPQTDFMTRQAHPKDVVARAIQLPGVIGSVVAMQDGLRVASEVPAELNADTLAAFLPQIFERVNQSTRELRMGALNNINFTVGNVPWRIFRVNAVYFAAFGRAGESLPAAQLAQLAAELDRKK